MRISVVVLTVAGLSCHPSLAGEVVSHPSASEFLPLEVGNSWTYSHAVFDEDVGILAEWDGFFTQDGVTITVAGAEIIEGKTYYLISDMPATGPPAPHYFIAGKKLRWDGIYLVELMDDGVEAPLYPFLGADGSDERRGTPEGHVYREIRVPETPEGDIFIIVSYFPADFVLPLGRHQIRFTKWHEEYRDELYEQKGGLFVEGFGIANWFWVGNREFYSSHNPELSNHLTAVRAEIGGVTLLYEDIQASGEIWGTSAEEISWGSLKELRQFFRRGN